MDGCLIQIRFHGRLNDFLRYRQCGRFFRHSVRGHPSLGDTIEALGVPHTEVGRLSVRRRPARWSRQVRDGDRIEVWPDAARLRRGLRFALDVHLGKLARYLRLLGFDTLYQNQWDDAALAQTAARERRIVLTRDVGLLKFKIIRRGYWLRHESLAAQLKEVLGRYGRPRGLRPFKRCLTCNGTLVPVAKARVRDKIPPKAALYFRRFFQCGQCAKVFWQGSHYRELTVFYAGTAYNPLVSHSPTQDSTYPRISFLRIRPIMRVRSSAQMAFRPCGMKGDDMNVINRVQGFFQRNSQDYENLLRRIEETGYGSDIATFRAAAFLAMKKAEKHQPVLETAAAA